MRLTEHHPIDSKVELGSHVFTADEIVRYAKRFDPQPFHVDPEAARHTLFGGLCASGWHTCAVWMRTFVDHWERQAASIRRDGLEPPKLGPSAGFKKLQWLRPVFAEDTITFFVTLLDSRPMASKPGWLMNTILCEGFNQDGVAVLRFESSVLEFE
jgi:acyl dehydratase